MLRVLLGSRVSTPPLAGASLVIGNFTPKPILYGGRLVEIQIDVKGCRLKFRVRLGNGPMRVLLLGSTLVSYKSEAAACVSQSCQSPKCGRDWVAIKQQQHHNAILLNSMQSLLPIFRAKHLQCEHQPETKLISTRIRRPHSVARGPAAGIKFARSITDPKSTCTLDKVLPAPSLNKPLPSGIQPTHIDRCPSPALGVRWKSSFPDGWRRHCIAMLEPAATRSANC